MSHVSLCSVYSTVILAFIIFNSVQCLIQKASDDALTVSESIDEKRGGGRNFQSEKRGGGRQFQGFEEKRGGARDFVISNSQEKRGGGRTFGFADQQDKRGGGRTFGFADAHEKRGGGRTFGFTDLQEKRGGGHVFGLADNVEYKRGGGRTFGFADSQGKRGGARIFGFAEPEDKRGGAHGFRSIRDISDQKRSEDIPAQLYKRGGARQFAAGSGENSLEKRLFAENEGYDSAEKRGGARPFFGGFGSYKRGGGRFFASPYSSSFYVPRAGYGSFGFDKRSATYGDGLRENLEDEDDL